MKFELNTNDGCWYSKTKLDHRGLEVEVSLEIDEETFDADKEGQTFIEHVNKNWGNLEKSILNDLFETHIDWSDPSNGRPSFSEKGFLEKLIPCSISYGRWEDEEGLHQFCSLNLTDSNIFGGHLVNVTWDFSDGKISAQADLFG